MSSGHPITAAMHNTLSLRNLQETDAPFMGHRLFITSYNTNTYAPRAARSDDQISLKSPFNASIQGSSRKIISLFYFFDVGYVKQKRVANKSPQPEEFYVSITSSTW